MADAAIDLLGSQGARGLSHEKVDQHAGLPRGTTSFYFRTRRALLHGIAARLTDLDIADLSRMTELSDDMADGFTGTAGLARLVMASNAEPYLTRSRARYELALQMSREPELAQTLMQFAAKFYALAESVIRDWHASDPAPDPRLVEEQAVMVLTMINGVILSFVHGAPVVSEAAQLERWIQAMLEGGAR